MSTEPDAALWIDPQRMGGNVCVMGTRIDTETIAGVAWQHGVQAVRDLYEDLTDWQILCALWWEWQYERVGPRAKWASEAREMARDASVPRYLNQAPVKP